MASKLTDDDLRDTLLCVNAGDKLKRIKLTNCVSITGHGLEPLRGSSVLEQIDLCSFHTGDRENDDPEMLLTEGATIPI